MGKKKDVTPRKRARIDAMLNYSNLKQCQIAKKLNVSTQTVSLIKKNIQLGNSIGPDRMGKCGRKRITTPRTDRKIKNLALNDRRASCRKISSVLASEGTLVHRRTINNRLQEAGLKSYRPRKKPRLTEKMKESRYKWAKEHCEWTAKDWEKVRTF